MVPALLHFYSREPEYIKKVIYKIGDDLRQDVLTLQIFNIMDKLWLENNLDLKLLPYKVCPTELKAGFIECLVGIELDKLQAQDGVAGVLDRELIVKYLRKTGKQSSPLETKFDNFIKSLAGYCVATCVIGIGDRHPGNIMIKENGIYNHNFLKIINTKWINVVWNLPNDKHIGSSFESKEYDKEEKK